MYFWVVVMIVAIVAILTEFVVRIVKIATKHYENIQRIKHGYPTINGDVPIKSVDTETNGDFHGTSLASNTN